jgi:hypothetical protein
VNVIDIRIAPQERRPLGVDHPGDFGLGVGIADRRHRRQRVHHVTEGTRLDDQDGTDFSFQISGLRLEEALTNLQTEIYHLKFLLPSQFQPIGQHAR